MGFFGFLLLFIKIVTNWNNCPISEMESEETKILDKSSNLFVPPIEMNTHTQRQNNYLNTNIY